MRRPPRPPDSYLVGTSAENNRVDGDYAALRGSIALTEGVATIGELVGGLALLASVFGFVLFSSWKVPFVESIIALVALAIIGLAGLFTGWRLHVSAALVSLQINLATDAKRAADAAEGLAARLEMQLRAISASTARTTEAVEALAASVRKQTR